MKQHKKACATCPFSKRSKPGELGGSPIEMFVGQAYGAFWLPCHEATDYSDPNWKEKYDTPQCAGAAIYRSNCHPADRPATLLNLPAGSDTNVFTSVTDFVAHHMQVSIGMAETLVSVVSPEALHEIEMRKAEAKFITEDQFK